MHIPSVHGFVEVEFDAEMVHRHHAPNKVIYNAPDIITIS